MKEDKPIRDYKKTLLAMVENSVGTNLFRNYWVSTDQNGSFDAMGDGDLSCAFYVSSLLAILGKIHRVHATVGVTISDLEKSGWTKVENAEAGDVILWTPHEPNDLMLHQHVGFYIGDEMCVSNLASSHTPQKHTLNYAERRYVEAIYRLNDWQDESLNSRVV